VQEGVGWVVYGARNAAGDSSPGRLSGVLHRLDARQGTACASHYPNRRNRLRAFMALPTGAFAQLRGMIRPRQLQILLTRRRLLISCPTDVPAWASMVFCRAA